MIESDSPGTVVAHATVFGNPQYLRALATVSGMGVERIATLRAELLATTRRRGPVREIALPRFTPFSGVSLPPLPESDVHAGSDALNELAETLESRYKRVRLALPVSVRDARPLQWRGWEISPLYTYVVEPSKGTSAWSSAARRTLKKNQEAFVARVDRDAVADVIDLMIASYRRHGRPAPVDASALEAACRDLIEANMAECAVVTRDDRVAAGIVLLHGPEASYYWIAGSEPGPAMTVLLAFVVGKLAERGVARLDMVGANTPTIAEFKRRLGAEMVTYWTARYESGLVARAHRSLKYLIGR